MCDYSTMHEKYGDLFFKNGKAERRFCLCMNKDYKKEIIRINGFYNPSWACGGNRCPYYAIGCGKENIKQFEN